jgi:hypothetical protein
VDVQIDGRTVTFKGQGTLAHRVEPITVDATSRALSW